MKDPMDAVADELATLRARVATLEEEHREALSLLGDAAVLGLCEGLKRSRFVARHGETAPPPTPDLDAARAAAREALERADKATLGPWRSTWGDDKPPGETVEDDIAVEAVGRTGIERIVVGALWYDGPNSACRAEDAAFIAAARADVPALASHVEALADMVDTRDREVAALKALVTELQDTLAVYPDRRALAERRVVELKAERDRWKEATHKLASEADTDDVTEARRAAAMWEARYREAEEAHARDAAVLRALRGEVERLRAPVGGADREAELDRIAEAQRARMAPVAAPEHEAQLLDAIQERDDAQREAEEAEHEKRAMAGHLTAARALVAELEASAPAGHRVAALIAEVTAAQSPHTGGWFEQGYLEALKLAARLITAHLGTPSPLDAVVAKVMAVGVGDRFGRRVIRESVFALISTLATNGGERTQTKRDDLRDIAAVALAGMLACDAPASAAAKGGPL